MPGPLAISHPIPGWHLKEWANSKALTQQDLQNKVVLVRFWTNTCPYCEASLPAIQKLAEEFKDKPVVFIGISKPYGVERSWESAVSKSVEFGVSFPIAYDREWKKLRQWWLDNNEKARATSVSFLFGKDGKLKYIHSGPEFHPPDGRDHKKCNEDYDKIFLTIKEELGK